jgi:hypothetical protein
MNKMDHYYQIIPGWFRFLGAYTMAVQRAPADVKSVFVEVGSWKGRSSAFLGVEIVNSKKPIALHCVDTFKGTPGESEHDNDPDRERLAQVFASNMMPLAKAGLDLLVHVGKSVVAAGGFDDGSVDFCWLDGDHSEEAVYADIGAWLPKMKEGGVMGGDDWPWASVRKAVSRRFDGERMINVCSEDGWQWWMVMT